MPEDRIRFKAYENVRGHISVEGRIGYLGTQRLIEPYSLRRTQDGNLLLYAVKHETGEIRSYRVDRIQEAQPTNVSFIPKYMIELTPSGAL
jgi:hypothetical protein